MKYTLTFDVTLVIEHNVEARDETEAEEKGEEIKERIRKQLSKAGFTGPCDIALSHAEESE